MKTRLLLVVLATLLITACGQANEPDPAAVARAVNATIAALPTTTPVILEVTPAPSATPTVTTAMEPTSTPSPEPTAPPSPADRIPPRHNYIHPYTVKEEYDRFTGNTVVDLGPSNSEMRRLPQGTLWVHYTYEGHTPSMPSVVTFSLWSLNDDWEYLNCHSLRLLVDGVPMALETQHLGKVMSGKVSETVLAMLDTQDFLTIANANTVEGRLCNNEFELTDKQKNALKDVASRMATGTLETAIPVDQAETAVAPPYDLALLRVDQHFTNGSLGVSGTFHNLGDEASPPLVVAIAFRNKQTDEVITKRQEIGSLAPDMSMQFEIVNEVQGDWSYTITLETPDAKEVDYKDLAD